MDKKDQDVTKEDLILVELRNIKEIQKDLKKNQDKIEESVNKRFDDIKSNDLTHIENELKGMTNVFNIKFDEQSKEFNTKFDKQGEELHKLDKDNISINKSLEWNNRITIATFTILLTIVLGAGIKILFQL
jgi:hypothetical protein